MNGRMHSRVLPIVWWFHEWLSANEGPQMRNSREVYARGGQEKLRPAGVYAGRKQRGREAARRGERKSERGLEWVKRKDGRGCGNGGGVGRTTVAAVAASSLFAYNSITRGELLS